MRIPAGGQPRDEEYVGTHTHTRTQMHLPVPRETLTMGARTDKRGGCTVICGDMVVPSWPGGTIILISERRGQSSLAASSPALGIHIALTRKSISQPERGGQLSIVATGRSSSSCRQRGSRPKMRPNATGDLSKDLGGMNKLKSG